jgi:nitric oxide reductase subunit C
VAPGVVLVGPSLAGVAKTSVARLQDPQYHGTARTAAEYLEEAILQPNVFIVPDGLYASPQRVSFMPDTLGKTLTPEEVKDLVAYLMTLQ